MSSTVKDLLSNSIQECSKRSVADFDPPKHPLKQPLFLHVSSIEMFNGTVVSNRGNESEGGYEEKRNWVEKKRTFQKTDNKILDWRRTRRDFFCLSR